MSSVCSLDPDAHEEVLRRLTALAEALKRDFDVTAVYVFGSFARRDEHEGSDIDLLVVGEIPGRVFDRVGEVLKRTDLPVEPIVIRPQSFRRRVAEGHPLFSRIEKEGVRLA